ncbi:MAG: hypothetical protein ACO4BW_00445 [Nitriliruptoraceae bacterium]
MAARRRSEEQGPEVGLVADPDGDADEEVVPEGFSVAGDDEEDEDALEDEDELEDGVEDLDDELEDGLDEEDLADVDAVLAGATAAPGPGATDEEPPKPDALPADDDEDEIEGIRDDIEFICVRCRLVKRTSQLAKGARKKEPFCRSCA